MRKTIVGNWKMHGSPAMAHSLVDALSAEASRLPASAEIVICPPATLIHEVAGAMTGFEIRLGGQDCHTSPEGAYTGDISARMLKDAGCAYVIVGHSERRAHHCETNQKIGQKAACAMASGLIPIICVGETQEQRDAGQAEQVVGTQLREALPKAAESGNFMLAYEPVWAIGSGKTPTDDDIRRMHAYIVGVVSKQTGLAEGRIHVLYGGSVKAANARSIMALPGVAGVLVGGASLKADEFCAIIRAAVG